VRRSTRYALSAGVGLGVAALTTTVDDGAFSLIVMLPLVYGVTTALVLDNVETVRGLSGTGASPAIGMLGGGIGAGVAIGLFQQSFTVGVAGYGLFVFGMALVTAEIDGERSR
jgi:hypothetical protein